MELLRAARGIGVSASACLLVGLLLAAPASAATFFVDDGSPVTPTPCDDPPPANACRTINEAIVQARGAAFPGGDTIRVAPGNYPERIDLFNAADRGDVIDGAGIDSDPARGTIVNPTLLDGDPCCSSALGVADTTLRDVRVEVRQTGANVDRGGLAVNGANAAVRNVHVIMQIPASASMAVVVGGSPVTLDRLATGGAWHGPGVVAGQGGGRVTIRDSSILGGQDPAPIANDAVITDGGAIVVQRSHIRRTTPTGVDLRAHNPDSLTVDSSLITGGATAVQVVGDDDETHLATLRNATLDAGFPKITDGSLHAIEAVGNGAPTRVAVQLNSSIALERQEADASAGAVGSVTCSFSDVRFQTQAAVPPDGAIACGNVSGNTQSTPAALFRAGASDWQLRAPGSPAIDTGSPAALVPGESTTDPAGHFRILDGNRDCIVRRDKGAYEVAGFGCPLPGVTLDDPTIRIRHGLIPFRVSCSGPAPCDDGVVGAQTAKKVPLDAASKRRRIVRLVREATFSIPAGQTETVEARLTKRARKLFRKRRKVRATVELRVGEGAPTTAQAKVKKKRRKGR